MQSLAIIVVWGGVFINVGEAKISLKIPGCLSSDYWQCVVLDFTFCFFFLNWNLVMANICFIGCMFASSKQDLTHPTSRLEAKRHSQFCGKKFYFFCLCFYLVRLWILMHFLLFIMYIFLLLLFKKIYFRMFFNHNRGILFYS